MDNILQIKQEFNWKVYLHLNPKLKQIINHEKTAWKHFECIGYKENLRWKPNNQDKKILVVMPTYKRANNIDKIINMILSQTFTDWVFLIIDDGSTSDNINIFDNIKEKYKDNNKILFLRNDINCQVAKTLNRGINYLLENNFTHFTWISDDNQYYPNFLDILASDNVFFNYSSFIINNITGIKKLKYQNNANYKDYIDLIKYWKGCASFMWTKEAIKQIGFYREGINGCEDFEYLIRTFKINHLECKYIEAPLITYTLHNEFMAKYQDISNLQQKISQQYLENST